jgi:prevent-host-death family protein
MYKKPDPGTRKVAEAAAAYLPDAGAEWVSAATFKAECLRLIERVRQERTEVVVTRYGKPVARLVPYAEAPLSIFGHVAGAVVSHGDLVSPTGEDWDADA